MGIKAKECIKCGKLLSFMCSVIIFLVLLCFKSKIPIIYSNDASVRDLSSAILTLIMISQFFFVGVYARYGIFRGIGKPKLPAYIVLSTYYLLPFPLMFVLLFVLGMKESLLYGSLTVFGTMGLGNLLAVVILEMYLLFRLDWKSIIAGTQKRTGI